MKKEMTALEVAQVARALSSITISCRTSYKVARAFIELKDFFSKQASIVVAEEDRLVEEHGGTIVSGSPRFTSPDAAIAFAKAHNEMLADRDEFEFMPVDLSAYADNISLEPDALLVLDGIVIFEGTT